MSDPLVTVSVVYASKTHVVLLDDVDVSYDASDDELIRAVVAHHQSESRLEMDLREYMASPALAERRNGDKNIELHPRGSFG